MAHARLIKTCRQCLKTIRVDIVNQACEDEDTCEDVQREAVAYCPLCHKNTTQMANLIHLGPSPDRFPGKKLQVPGADKYVS